MLSEERARQQLANATTDAQRERMEELIAEGKDVYPYRWQGKGIIAAFRRYIETFDPEKITAGLYDFSIMGSGGLNDIAHYNLGGFRATYPHPAMYLENLLFAELTRWGPRKDVLSDPNYFHAQGVYADGVTKGEVLAEIVRIADAERERVLLDFKTKTDAAKLDQAKLLAEQLGLKLVPKED